MSTYDRLCRTNKRNELRTWVRSLKTDACMDCVVVFDPMIMQFDHRVAGTKRKAVSRMVADLYSRSAILLEIDKCDLVCPTCHAIRTAKRRA